MYYPIGNSNDIMVLGLAMYLSSLLILSFYLFHLQKIIGGIICFMILVITLYVKYRFEIKEDEEIQLKYKKWKEDYLTEHPK